MSKSLLIGAVRRAAPEVSMEVASNIVISILDTVAEELVTQGSFRWHHIGALRLIERPAKRGRNPSTGESIWIEPRTTVLYRLSAVLADRLNKKTVAGSKGVAEEVAGASAKA